MKTTEKETSWHPRNFGNPGNYEHEYPDWQKEICGSACMFFRDYFFFSHQAASIASFKKVKRLNLGREKR